jgi:hypothetical protein
MRVTFHDLTLAAMITMCHARVLVSKPSHVGNSPHQQEDDDEENEEDNDGSNDSSGGVEGDDDSSGGPKTPGAQSTASSDVITSFSVKQTIRRLSSSALVVR